MSSNKKKVPDWIREVMPTEPEDMFEYMGIPNGDETRTFRQIRYQLVGDANGLAKLVIETRATDPHRDFQRGVLEGVLVALMRLEGLGIRRAQCQAYSRAEGLLNGGPSVDQMIADASPDQQHTLRLAKDLANQETQKSELEALATKDKLPN